MARLCEHGVHARRPRPITQYVLSLAALALWLTAVGVPASAQPAPAAQGQRAEMAVTAARDHGHSPRAKHTQGALAVAVSVLGLIVVGGLLLLLAGRSVKRRTRPGPRDRDHGATGPPGRSGGRFL
jgi:hypothetical protein